MKPRLIALSGPVKGSVFPITEQPLAIGRAADNNIRLDDELVGKHHASVWLKQGRPFLSDGDSRNGTWIDGRAYLERFLEHGDRLKFGSSILLFFELDEAPDSLPLIIEEELDRNRTKDTLRADYSSRGELQVYYRAVGRAFGCMAESLNAISDIEQLLARLLEEAFKIIPAKRGAFLLNGHIATPDHWISEVYGHRDLGMSKRFTPSSKALGEVYSQRVPILAKDIAAVICVPLIVEARMRGVLYMEGTDSPSGFEPEDLGFLRKVAEFAVSGLRLARRMESLKDERDLFKDQVPADDEMIGESEAIQSVRKYMRKAAGENVTVLIIGETGTGKEMVARGIHKWSARGERPFVKISCSDMQDSLVQSELFGHVKGAFTDAAEARKGKLRKADGGTAFFDEVGELPLDMQPRFLRVLQEKTFEPVGGDETVTVDVRVIAATNVNLEEAVAQKQFRQDLFYRLNVFVIRMPPLRERRKDIPLLAIHFLHKYDSTGRIASIAPEAMDALVSYDWPGNIRDLENVIQAARIYASSEIIHLEDLPKQIRKYEMPVTAPGTQPETTPRRMQGEARWEQILPVLAKNRNDIPATARELGLSEGHVYRVVRRHRQQ